MMKVVGTMTGIWTVKTVYLRSPLSALRCVSSVLCLLSSVLCPVSFAQYPVDLIATWESGDLVGWTCGGSQAALSCVTNEIEGNTYLNLRFNSQTIAVYAEDVARTPVSNVLITNVSFRFLAGIHPSAVRVYLHSSRSGNSWYVNLPAPRVGEWTDYDVQVDFSGNWLTGPASRKEAFIRDMRSIDWAGVYVRRHGDTAAQDYGIDDFRVTGVYIPSSVSICGVLLYSGDEEGPARVSAVSVGEPDVSTNVTVSVTAPGAYEIGGLPPFDDYAVSAFLDSNSNGSNEFWEASGAWPANPVSLTYWSASNVDITLTEPKNPEGFSYAWLHRYFGVLTPDDLIRYGDMDSDQDGFGNWAEYRAGTNPKDASSLFELAIGTTNETGSVGTVLWWKSARNRSYTVWRSTDLMAGFTRLEQGIPGTPPVNVYRDNTATNSGPYFYRIDVEP